MYRRNPCVLMKSDSQLGLQQKNQAAGFLRKCQVILAVEKITRLSLTS